MSAEEIARFMVTASTVGAAVAVVDQSESARNLALELS